MYDDLGNLLQESSPDRGTTVYAYDAAGNVLTKTDARGVVATYTYDALNRVTAIDYPGTAEDVAFTYDVGANCTAGIGRLCQAVDASGTTQFSYNAFGNVTQTQKTELGIVYTTGYTYDTRDRVMSISYPDGRTVTYTRDGLGRIASTTATVNGANQTVVSGRTYRADGLLTAQSYGNGLSESRSYNLKGELTNQSLGSADTRVYGYDLNGNLSSLQSLPQVAVYTYDALDRLTQDQITSTPTSTNAFTYDPNGNRTADSVGSYSYTGNSNRLTQTPLAAITLDAAGNTTADGTYTYAYNQDGHLSQVLSGGNVIATYTYNYQRQRTQKVTAQGTTVYHYDLAGNLIAEMTAAGASISAYVWTDGQPNAQINAGTPETLVYLHADHLGTPRLATDASQTVVWRYEGSAFGDNAPTGSATVNLRFAGQYADGETGLYYNWNRYYDPRTGRYISSDPIGLGGGLNSYSYVYNDPLKFIDPTGFWSWTGGGYAGAGGEVTAGRDTEQGNRGFFTGRFGLGKGGGLSYDPRGGIPGPRLPESSISGTVLSFSGSASLAIGPFALHWEYGYGRTYNHTDEDTDKSERYGDIFPHFTGSLTDLLDIRKWKNLRFVGSVGGQVSIYGPKKQPSCQ